MSEVIGEKTRICIRYIYDPVELGFDPEENPYDELWLHAEVMGWTDKNGKSLPRRDYGLYGPEIDDPFDFMSAYGNDQDKAIAMAKRLGKIVSVGKHAVETESYRMEVVMVHEVTTKTVTCIDPSSPLVVLALQAE